jgi:anti-anti-sigma factor
MDTRQGRIGGVNVLQLSGELDYADTDGLLDKATVLFEQADRLVFDFTHLTCIDCGGIAVVYSLLERISLRNGGWIGVLNPSPNVLRILDLVGLLAQPGFPVFRSREELVLASAGLKDTKT